MGAQENGLTLEGLAQRLEALERENERMRSENAELRSKVATLEGSGTRTNGPAETGSLVPLGDGEQASGFHGRVSRRSLLSKAGVAAAGLVVAGALTQRDIREANATPTVFSTNTQRRGAVEGTNTAAFSYGVWGNAGTGVYGTSNVAGSAYGVKGHNTSINGGGGGVYGVNESGPGVLGWGKGTRNGSGFKGYGPKGVHGIGDGEAPEGAQGNIGVHGDGATGVWGRSSITNFSGVYGTHTDTAGNGVRGDGNGSTGAGVLGRNPEGIGVEGRESVYGGKFAGSRAQLRLVPAGSAGRPGGAHGKGEVYMDSAGALFVCVRGGTPGKWRKVSTTAV